MISRTIPSRRLSKSISSPDGIPTKAISVIACLLQSYEGNTSTRYKRHWVPLIRCSPTETPREGYFSLCFFLSIILMVPDKVDFRDLSYVHRSSNGSTRWGCVAVTMMASPHGSYSRSVLLRLRRRASLAFLSQRVSQRLRASVKGEMQ